MMVKICGITNREDALAAAEGGAAALGFNFYPRSPRYIDPLRAAELVAELPPAVWKVGVFVNAPAAFVADTARVAGLDVAQLSGHETAKDFPSGIRVWKAARVDADFDLADFESLPVEALVLDGPAGTLFGGSGLTFDWTRARNSRKPVIVAGGLGPENVRAAIEAARPWGVDACSRLESAPGRKDHAKMAAFLKAALVDS